MKNMRSKNRPKYYEAGGLLEMLTESSPTTLFEQRTKDRVARDLLRNEVEKPPRMMLSRGGLAGLPRRASGGIIGLQGGSRDPEEIPPDGLLARILDRLRGGDEGSRLLPPIATINQDFKQDFERRMAEDAGSRIPGLRYPLKFHRGELPDSLKGKEGRRESGMEGLKRIFLGRASGGIIPGYAFGGSMAGAYGGSPMKGPEDQPFGQKGGGWGSTPTAPAQGAGTFTPGPAPAQSGGKSQFLPAGGWGNAKTAPGGTGGIGTGIGGPGQAGPQPQQMQQQAMSITDMAPQGMQTPSPSNTYGLTQAQIGRGQRQTQQMQAGRPEQDQLQYRTGFSPAFPDRLPPSGPQQMQGVDPRTGLSLSAAGGGSRSDPFLNNPQELAQFQAQIGSPQQQPQQTAAMQQQQAAGQAVGQGIMNPGLMSMAQGPPGGFPPGSNIMYQSAPQSPGGDLGPTDPYAGTGGPGAPQPQAGPTYQAQALPEGYGSPTSYAGYGGPESFASRQEFVSPEVASQYADLTDSIMAVGTKPYEQYEGPQLASFTPEEKAAQDATAIYGTSEGPQGTLQAESTLDQAATSIGQVGADSQALAKTSAETTREIGSVDAALGKDADMSEYMSDYTQNVTDPQLRQLMEFQKQQGQELGSQAAASGAFGGYRQGIMQGQQAQQASQQAADIIGKGQQEAFQSAIGREQDDAQRTEAAYSRQLGTEKQASATEAAAQNQMLSASQAMANVGTAQTALGRQQQDQLQSRLREMQKSGASKRQLDQAALDIQKQQWEQGQQRPERQVAWMNQMLGQLPYQNIVQQGSYGPQAGPVSSAIGTGLQGAGMWEAWKARQAAGERTPQQNANDRAYDRRQTYADIGATATPYDSPNQPPYSPPIAAPNIPTGLRPMDYSNPTMDWANENSGRIG